MLYHAMEMVNKLSVFLTEGRQEKEGNRQTCNLYHCPSGLQETGREDEGPLIENNSNIGPGQGIMS